MAPTPADHFRHSTAGHPLERPRALPTRFAPLARTITGRATPPRYTTGAATRQALRSAGARAATTGTTLHLLEPPRATPHSLGVLAHELAHAAPAHAAPARIAPPAPRFLLGGLQGRADGEERHANALGNAVRAATSPLSAGRGVADLPVGAEAVAVARAAAQAAVAEALGSLPAPTGPEPAPAAPSTPARSDADRQAPAPATPAPEPVRSGDAETQFARLLEQLEDRLLSEIERRGGRYAGVF